MNKSDAQAIVAAGIAVLDEKGPQDWREKITKPVDIFTSHLCPLGQIYGDYVIGREKLKLGFGRDDLGFICGDSFNNANLVNQAWNEAAIAWKEAAQPSSLQDLEAKRTELQTKLAEVERLIKAEATKPRPANKTYVTGNFRYKVSIEPSEPGFVDFKLEGFYHDDLRLTYEVEHHSIAELQDDSERLRAMTWPVFPAFVYSVLKQAQLV